MGTEEARTTGWTRFARASWPVRSFLAGGAGATVDIALVVALVKLRGVDPILATALGIAVGGAINFLANKYLAFRDRDPHPAMQALRWAASGSLAFVLYEATYWSLTVRFGLGWFLAKLVADVLVFDGGGLLLNRYVIFPERSFLGREAVRVCCCLSLGLAFTGSPSLSAEQLFASSILTAPSARAHQGPVEVSVPVAGAMEPIAAQAAVVAPARLAPVSVAWLEQTPHAPRAPELRKRRRPPRVEG